MLMPNRGWAKTLAVRFANKTDVYGKYCGTVSQMTSVDIGKYIVAFIQLMQDKELRSQMETLAGSELAEYDWSVVVGMPDCGRNWLERGHVGHAVVYLVQLSYAIGQVLIGSRAWNCSST